MPGSRVSQRQTMGAITVVSGKSAPSCQFADRPAGILLSQHRYFERIFLILIIQRKRKSNRKSKSKGVVNKETIFKLALIVDHF